MAYSGIAVANAFIKRSLRSPNSLPDLTPMKLQKLIYYLQAWFYARKGQALIDEFFCRWNYGPVLPSVYHEFKSYGSNVISEMSQNATIRDDIIHFVRPIVDPNDEDAWFYIDQVIKRYGHFTAAQLSALSHKRDGAWAMSSPDGSPILNTDLWRDISSNA